MTFLYKYRPWGRYDRAAANAAFVPILAEQIGRGEHRFLVALGDKFVGALFGPEATARTKRGR